MEHNNKDTKITEHKKSIIYYLFSLTEISTAK